MKKIELHLHLDGSLDVQYASELMGYDVSNELVSSSEGDLVDYLKKFDLPIKLLQTSENIEEFSYRLAKDLVKDNVIYAEVRFCPLFHTELISVDEVVEAIKRGFNRVTEIKINLIFCMMRHFSFEDNKKIIELTEKHLNNGVCAIDLAGDEVNFKTESFEELFSIINKKGIPFTIHAGEAEDYTSVDMALMYGAKRIGHGIKSINSMDTVNRLIKNNVLLEMCPTSNLNTNAFSNISEHSIRELYDLGVRVCINTDNRTVSNTTLENEYKLLQDAFGFTEDDFLQFNLNAVDGAFLSDEEKNILKEELLND